MFAIRDCLIFSTVVVGCILVALGASASAADDGDEIELISGETLFKNDFEYLKQNKYLLLIVCHEKTCTNKLDLFKQLNKLVSLKSEIDEKIAVRLSIDPSVTDYYAITKTPRLMFYRDQNYVVYKGGDKDLREISDWIEATKEKLTTHLADRTFEHLTQAASGATTGDWFVLFYKKNCKTYEYIQPSWEMAAISLKGRCNFAYVETEKNARLAERFAIFNSPTLFFFRQGFMYRYDIDKLDEASLVSFVENKWYKNFKAERVPLEPSAFDAVVDSIVEIIKENPIYIYLFFMVIFLTLCFFAVTVMLSGKQRYPQTSGSAYKND